jgi:hypothetical protein
VYVEAGGVEIMFVGVAMASPQFLNGILRDDFSCVCPDPFFFKKKCFLKKNGGVSFQNGEAHSMAAFPPCLQFGVILLLCVAVLGASKDAWKSKSTMALTCFGLPPDLTAVGAVV